MELEYTEHDYFGRSFRTPAGDFHSWNYFVGTDMVNIAGALAHVPFERNKLCIQAGGNLGYFPIEFAKTFDKVITFEPDPTNFRCLVHNCIEDNIIKYQAALSDVSGSWVEIEIPDPAHVGLNQIKVSPNSIPACQVPTMRIDDLDLTACDLIQLDLEGYEYYALLGAVETIKTYKPTLVLELTGHETKYGVAPNAIMEFLHAWGYTQVGQYHLDKVFVSNG